MPRLRAHSEPLGRWPIVMIRSSYFIFSPLQDILFVLFTPLLILGTFAAARAGGWMDGLIAFGLALAVGHYLPGIVRAYGDRELFKRFRFRLIVVPLLLLSTTIWFAYRDLHAVIFLQMLWGGWHWSMQTYGFARIYDAKAPAEARTPAVLDRLLCLMWFGTWMLSADPSAYLKTFYESGGPLLRASVVGLLTRGWFVATVALTIVYVIHTLAAIRRGRVPNPLKFVFVALTFIYLSHTTSMIDQPVVGLVMFESWHDIQYLAIVWLFNVNRGKRKEAGPFIHFLFRPKAIWIAAYVISCLAFGTLNFAWHLFDNPVVARVVLSLVTATALLHYYLDGFIWRIREVETRDALGVSTSDQLRAPTGIRRIRPASFIPAWSTHALLWLLFVIPAALLFATESKGGSALRIHESVVETLPNSARARYDIGKALQDAGRFREARTHLETALALAPDLLPARISLGMVLANQGDLEGAKMQLKQALALDPRSAEAHNNLAVVLDEQGDLAGAKSHLQHAVNYSPKQATFQNNLGRLLAKSGDLAGARVHQERALYLDANFVEAHYQLGLTLAKQGALPEAVQHLQQALRIDPEQYLAHNALGGVFMNLGRTGEARVHFEHALRINPDYVSAQQNLANLIEKSNPLRD